MPTKNERPKAPARRREIVNFLEKIVVNAGVGRASQQPNFEEKLLPQISRDLAAVTGQKPQTRPAKRSVAGFKIREGQTIGLRATLRGRLAVDFFERLITIVLPRVRDFNGLEPTIIDEHGALNIGLKEQFVFPEINPEESTFIFPLAVTIVPKKRARAEALEAYRKFGVPLKK